MSQQDEIINLVLKTQGQENIRKLYGDIDQLKGSVLASSNALGVHDAATLKLAGQLKVAEDQVEQLERKFGKLRSGLADRARRCSRPGASSRTSPRAASAAS